MRQLSLPVIGMTCSICTGLIERHLSRLSGVSAVSVDLVAGKATVDYDPQTVTVVDGNMVYTREIDTFLASWSVLGDMAITAADISN